MMEAKEKLERSVEWVSHEKEKQRSHFWKEHGKFKVLEKGHEAKKVREKMVLEMVEG
jgi:hypothetical protein